MWHHGGVHVATTSKQAERPGAMARAWAAVRDFYFAPAKPTGRATEFGKLSFERPRGLLSTPSTTTQARELRYAGYQSHPGYGCTPDRVVQLFRQAEQGSPMGQCDLFDDIIERDCTLRNLLDQREQSVAGKPATIQAGGPSERDELAARVLATAFRDLSRIALLQHQIGGANRYGWGATEVVWEPRSIEGRDWIVPVWLAHVPARRFAISNRNELLLVTDAAPSGEALEAGKWMVTQRPGPLARAALMRSAIWPAMWKSFSARDWVVYAEMFGIPLVHATYADGAGGEVTDDNSRALAEEIVAKIGSSGGAVTPESIKVTIHEGRKADGTGLHGSLIAWSNAEMSKLINGSTLANDNAGSGGASYALGAVHDAVRWDNVQYDAALVEDAFGRSISAQFILYNGLVGVAPPALRIQVVRDVAPEVRLRCADIARNKLGIPLSLSQLRFEAGFREPLGPDDAIEPPAPAPVTPAMPAQGEP